VRRPGGAAHATRSGTEGLRPEATQEEEPWREEHEGDSPDEERERSVRERRGWVRSSSIVFGDFFGVGSFDI
jgi:hypothetical protein